MQIRSRAIVSNSDMIAKYRLCREKAGHLGKLFIFRNNQPDAIMFSITEYERLSPALEYLEALDETEAAEFFESLSKYLNGQ